MSEKVSSIGASVFPIQGGFDSWPTNYQDFSKPGLSNSIKAYASAWNGFLDSDN